MSYISVAQYASSEDTKKTAPKSSLFLYYSTNANLSVYNSPT